MFNTLATTNEVVTMSSLEMVDFINQTREENEPEIRHDNFMKKVGKVLGEQAPKFEGTSFYVNGIGARVSRLIYNFPRREATLMAMSYSYKLQAKVLDRMNELEQAAQAKAIQQSRTPAEPMLPVQQAKVSLECFLDVAKLLAVPTHLAQTESIKQVRLTTGVDFSPFLLLAPAQNDIQAEEVMLEPTELGAALGYSRNKINPALEAAGLQERVDGVWAPTAKGAKFCIRHHWQVGNKSGYNLKWNLQAVRQLVSEAEKKAA
jgi:hypothetical protein